MEGRRAAGGARAAASRAARGERQGGGQSHCSGGPDLLAAPGHWA